MPKYSELAQQLKDNKNILVAKIDGTKNELEGYTVKGFPTIRLYKRDNKHNPVDYMQARQLNDLLYFLKKETNIDYDLKTQDL